MFLSFRMVVFQFHSNWTKTRLANGESKSATIQRTKSMQPSLIHVHLPFHLHQKPVCTYWACSNIAYHNHELVDELFHTTQTEENNTMKNQQHE